MIQLILEKDDNVVETIKKIKELKDLNVDLVIPKGSVLFQNSLNLKLIQLEVDKLEKSVHFSTEDEVGNNLIQSVEGKDSQTPLQVENISLETPALAKKKKKISLPKLSMPNFKVHLPKILLGNKNLILLILGILIFLISFVVYGLTAPTVTAKITVRAQPLTRSVTIIIKSNTQTDVQQKILRGSTLSTTIDNTSEISTSGTKTVGEKASGEVNFYNYTLSSVTLDKNTKVTYEGKSTDLVYLLKDSVTIPAGSVPDPGNPLVPGESSEDVVASDIGETYNISDGKTLKIKNYDKDDVVAKTKEDLTGGKSEIVKIVSADDRTKLSSSTSTDSIAKAKTEISAKLAANQKLVTGSIDSKILKETFSKNAGDEAEKLSLTQSIAASGLVYFENDLNRFLDEYVKDLIPSNYVLSSQSREVGVEVLGNSTNSVLSSTVADIQVTLKTFVVPDINEEDIKKQLVGKSPSEAEKILGSIKNVNTYEFKLSPSVPFFKRVPNDIRKISLTIEKN